MHPDGVACCGCRGVYGAQGLFGPCLVTGCEEAGSVLGVVCICCSCRHGSLLERIDHLCLSTCAPTARLVTAAAFRSKM